MSVFKSFNEVVSLCYGTELHPKFQCKIAIFAKGYIKLGITVTPKVHTVKFHVAEFCLNMDWGICPLSEQAGENVSKKIGRGIK